MKIILQIFQIKEKFNQFLSKVYKKRGKYVKNTETKKDNEKYDLINFLPKNSSTTCPTSTHMEHEKLYLTGSQRK